MERLRNGMDKFPCEDLLVFKIDENTYEPGSGVSIELYLRRTLMRFVLYSALFAG